MKAIVCGQCVDIRAILGEDDAPVTCACGNVTGWWVDPARGIAKVFAYDRDNAKIMGVMNSLLGKAFSAYDYSSERWREIHGELTDAPGYLFDKNHRACPVVICAIGNSSDITWADELPGTRKPD